MISCDIERKWSSNWISAGFCLNNWQAPARPAPYFRRAFEWDGRGEAVVYLCGLGYYELYLNGEKVDSFVDCGTKVIDADSAEEYMATLKSQMDGKDAAA